MFLFFFFFFKQKTAYEMRISDWSSDVCSSDLLIDAGIPPERLHVVRNAWQPDGDRDPLDRDEARRRLGLDPNAFIAGWVGRISQIGRASCRERVCQYV